MSLRRSLGMRGLPTGRDFQRQRRRNPWRCQRTKVSGRTFTRASRHANRRPRITIISRVVSSARCGFTFRSWNRASGLRRKRFSLASARRDLEPSPRRRTRSHATEDNAPRLCVSYRYKARNENFVLIATVLSSDSKANRSQQGVEIVADLLIQTVEFTALLLL